MLHRKRSVYLQAQNFGVDRGGVPIVRGIHFLLEPGQVIEIFGANGAGKTSLLRAIAGLSVRHGQLAWREDEDAVWENDFPPGLFAWQSHRDSVQPLLTPREHLLHWSRIGGLTEDVGSALDQVGIGEMAELPARLLSAGQRRRLSLAWLALSASSIWLMDEPVASLDEAGVALVRQCLGDHLGGGGSAIVASHIPVGIEMTSRIKIERPS